jgi:2,3,4,5-tetrahydropyridine-2-carboxylate N-succinyltransferase
VAEKPKAGSRTSGSRKPCCSVPAADNVPIGLASLAAPFRFYDKVATRSRSSTMRRSRRRAFASFRRPWQAAWRVHRAQRVLMPSYVNIGAYVDSGTMVDTWATVVVRADRQERIFRRRGIGGARTAAGTPPHEDNCFIGARSKSSRA